MWLRNDHVIRANIMMECIILLALLRVLFGILARLCGMISACGGKGRTMVEYIKKEEVIKLIREDKVEITQNLLTIAMLSAPNGYSAEDCYKAINDTCDRHIKEIRNLQAFDAVERKKGEWIPYEIHYDVYFKCSECGNGETQDQTNYCPFCGAEMR